MEFMSPFTVALEKFVICYKINQENVPMIRSVLIKKLTREFTILPGDDLESKVSQFFSNIESGINKLRVDGGHNREDAVELHLKELWRLNKAHKRCEMTDTEGVRDAEEFQPDGLRETSLRERFEEELQRFLSHVKFDGITPQEIIVGSL